MSVFRRVILPIFWVAIGAVAALALAKLAFFSDSSPQGAHQSDGISPTGEIAEPQIAVGRGTVRTDLEIQATVLNDPAREVKVDKDGEVIDVFVTPGNRVITGQVLASVRKEIPREGQEPFAAWSEIISPADGILTSFTPLSGQTVAIADVVGAVAPPTFRVQGTLAAEDRYKLLHQPTEATVAVGGGPAPFTCSGLAIETPLPGTAQAGGTDNAGDGGNIVTTIHCAVPSEVTVFPGLGAKLTIAGGLAENALVVPVTSVRGSAQSGVVFIVGPDGEAQEREVGIGLNDSKQIEITSGLEEGETILEYVPGDETDDDTADAPTEEG